MMLKASGELATSTPTPRATIRMCTTRAACWPRMPQMERRKPEFRELLMVLIAPAPGVKLIRTPAPTRASQRDSCTCQVYGFSRQARVDEGEEPAESGQPWRRPYSRIMLPLLVCWDDCSSSRVTG